MNLLNRKELHQLTMMQDEVTNYLLNDSGLRTYANKMADYLGGSIYIHNPYKDNLIYSDEFLKNNEEFNNFIENRKLLKRDIAFACCQHTIHENTYEVETRDGKKKLEKEIELKLVGEENLGIIAVKDYNELSEFEFRIMIVISHAIAVKIHQNKVVTQLGEKCSSELIEDLLNQRYRNIDDLVKRGEMANWNLNLNYQLYLISLESKEEIPEEDSYFFYEIKERVMQLIRSYIKNYLRREYLLFFYDSKMVLMIHYEDEKRIIRDEIEMLLAELVASLNNYHINIGAGRFIENIDDTAESYREADYILDFLKTTQKNNTTYFYKDLGILRLLWNVDREELRKFSVEYLSNLIEYDKNNSAEWLDTLGVYLEEGGSIQKAAERLYIHPNTMSYRVKRIKEILGIDLQDQDVQFNLSAAYKICKYILNDDFRL